MSNQVGNIIADSLALGLGFSARMLTDVTASQFARMAAPGGITVISNHPAFLYGHLSLYAPRIIEQLGGDAAEFAPSEQANSLFSKDAVCQDDENGSIYPAMEEITDRFTRAYQAAERALREADDQAFAQPNPAEGRMKELFPTIGSMHAFYAGGHFMIHMGQMSAWRRMMGLGPA